MKLLSDFLTTSRDALNALIKEVALCDGPPKEAYTFSALRKGKERKVKLDSNHFFIRTSIEYSSPQLTLEEIQGIIAARLLEVCGNYLEERGGKDLDRKDMLEILEMVKKPPRGRIVPFMLNADDIEPDRYSNNPLRASIVQSGQSAFPVATVDTSDLEVDNDFVSKYTGSLISDEEVDFIKLHLHDQRRYVDLVDFVKNDSLENLSDIIGIDLCLPILRMPINILMNEDYGDPLHLTIQESHGNRDVVEAIYGLMKRSIKKKRTLLTTPHSEKGFGSKRSAVGRLIFDGSELKQINVKYRTVKLYPNMADPNDISHVEASDSLSVKIEELNRYEYSTTPSSPLFCLYVILSPENASLSHGVGAYAGSEILKSYSSIYEAFIRRLILEEVPKTQLKRAPLTLNLVPEKMWLHPQYENLDASIGCMDHPKDLLDMGMTLERLDFQQEIVSRLSKIEQKKGI